MPLLNLINNSNLSHVWIAPNNKIAWSPGYPAMVGYSGTLFAVWNGLSAYSFNGALLVYIASIDSTYNIYAISYTHLTGGWVHTASINAGIKYYRRYNYDGFVFNLSQSVVMAATDIVSSILSDTNYVYRYGSRITSSECPYVSVVSKTNYVAILSSYTGSALGYRFNDSCEYKTWQIAGTSKPASAEALLCAFSFSGATISLAGTRNLGLDKYISSDVYSICADNNYVYVYMRQILVAYTFNGSTFTKVGSLITGVASATRNEIDTDGTYIFLTDPGNNTLLVYVFDGSNFTLVYQLNDPITSVFNAGSYLFCRSNSSGGEVYGINKTSSFLIKIGSNWKNVVRAFLIKSGVFKEVRDVKMDLSETWKNSI